MDYKTRAIIVKTQKLSDSDKIISLYSPEYGLIKAVAKGAFKINSRFCSKSDTLIIANFLLAKGRNLDIVKEITVENTFKNIRSDYDKLSLAFFMADIIENIAIKDENYQLPFGLLNESLEVLDQPESSALIQILIFKWKLIDFLGYKPELNHCGISQIKRENNQIPLYFDFESGSIISSKEYSKLIDENPYQDQIKAINKNTFKILDYLDQNIQLNSSEEEKISDPELISAIKVLHKHLEYRLHKEFKSWKVLELSVF